MEECIHKKFNPDEKSLCRFVKHEFISCLDPPKALLEKCLPAKSKDVPDLIVDMLLALFRYICNAKGSELLGKCRYLFIHGMFRNNLERFGLLVDAMRQWSKSPRSGLLNSVSLDSPLRRCFDHCIISSFDNLCRSCRQNVRCIYLRTTANKLGNQFTWYNWFHPWKPLLFDLQYVWK